MWEISAAWATCRLCLMWANIEVKCISSLCICLFILLLSFPTLKQYSLDCKTVLTCATEHYTKPISGTESAAHPFVASTKLKYRENPSWIANNLFAESATCAPSRRPYFFYDAIDSYRCVNHSALDSIDVCDYYENWLVRAPKIECGVRMLDTYSFWEKRSVFLAILISSLKRIISRLK